MKTERARNKLIAMLLAILLSLSFMFALQSPKTVGAVEVLNKNPDFAKLPDKMVVEPIDTDKPHQWNGWTLTWLVWGTKDFHYERYSGSAIWNDDDTLTIVGDYEDFGYNVLWANVGVNWNKKENVKRARFIDTKVKLDFYNFNPATTALLGLVDVWYEVHSFFQGEEKARRLNIGIYWLKSVPLGFDNSGVGEISSLSLDRVGDGFYFHPQLVESSDFHFNWRTFGINLQEQLKNAYYYVKANPGNFRGWNFNLETANLTSITIGLEIIHFSPSKSRARAGFTIDYFRVTEEALGNITPLIPSPGIYGFVILLAGITSVMAYVKFRRRKNGLEKA